MIRVRRYLLLGGLVLLGACASNYEPIIDSKGVDMGRYEQDLFECRSLAAQVDAGENAATGALVGAGVGAALGAALGAISGDAGVGAATGAAIGGFGGAGSETADSVVRQKNILNNCLIGRGYRVLG